MIYNVIYSPFYITHCFTNVETTVVSRNKNYGPKSFYTEHCLSAEALFVGFLVSELPTLLIIGKFFVLLKFHECPLYYNF